MQQLLTPESLSAVMGAYHGFHDAEIKRITLRPLDDGSGHLDVEVELVATNHQCRKTEIIELFLHKVVEMKFSYDKNIDYPNVRDEIAVGFYDNLAYVDFGAACESRTSPSDYRSLDRFFVCESVSLSITG